MAVVHDSWDSYVTNTDDGPLFISFDLEAAKEDLTDRLGHCARVLIPIHSPNASGGPVPPENEHLWEMEDALCTTLSEHAIDCRLVARLTMNGVRELVFQLDNWDSFRPPVGLWMQQNTDYEIDVSEHEGWDFFNDCVRPSEEDWLFMADRDVVAKLVEAGSDPDTEHALEFVFTGNPDRLKSAAERLQSR